MAGVNEFVIMILLQLLSYLDLPVWYSDNIGISLCARNRDEFSESKHGIHENRSFVCFYIEKKQVFSLNVCIRSLLAIEQNAVPASRQIFPRSQIDAVIDE